MTQAATQSSPTAGAGDKPLAKKESFQYQPLMRVGNAAGLHGLANVMRDRIAAVLPKHVTPERMLKALMVAASKTPAIFECTQESICKSLMDASTLGLDCSGTLGSGYLIPFKKNTKHASGKWQSRRECQFIPGYRGLIDLARRGGQIASISAHAVYAQDTFTLEYGTEEKIAHKPFLGADRREEYICFYAIATFRDGTKQPEVMTLADVLRVRDGAMAKNHQQTVSGPWADHFSEMARKTVVRRLCKYLPLSPELEKAFELDDAANGEQETIKIVDATMIDTTNRTAALADRLTGEIIDPETGEVVEQDPDTAAKLAEQKARLQQQQARAPEYAEDGQLIPPGVGQPPEAPPEELPV